MSEKAEQRPVEDRMRAFALYMDYVPASVIARHLDVSVSTITRWSRDGLMFQGFQVTWDQIREVTDADRAFINTQIGSEKEDWWLKYRDGFNVDAARGLESVRKKLIQRVENDDEDVEMKVSDLPKIIQAEMLLQGRATQIIEQTSAISTMAAQALRNAVMSVITDDSTRKKLIDRVGQEFKLLNASIVDEKSLTKKG